MHKLNVLLASQKANLVLVRSVLHNTGREKQNSLLMEESRMVLDRSGGYLVHIDDQRDIVWEHSCEIEPTLLC